MNFLLITLAVILTLQNVKPTVAEEKYFNEGYQDKALYEPDIFEGDMVISPEQFKKNYGRPYADISKNVRL